MRPAIALVIAAACGSPASPSTPQARPELQLVRCRVARPIPAAVERAPRAARPSRQPRTEGEPAGRQPKVTLGSVTVPRGVSFARVYRALRDLMPVLNTCFVRNPGVTKVTAVYEIELTSSGVPARIATTAHRTLGPGLHRCVERALRKIHIPPTVGGTVMVPLTFVAAGKREAPRVREPQQWTPFALGEAGPGRRRSAVVRATGATVRARLPAIERCFQGPAPAGSLRVMLEVAAGGEVQAVRAGGLGDAVGEACVARALTGTEVVMPTETEAEVACDLARGDARSWRIALDTGYEVIELERDRLRHEAATLVPGATDPGPLPRGTYVVVARPDSPGAMLQLALLWAREATAVLLAIGDGATAPLYLGIGEPAVSDADAELRPRLRVDREQVTGCVGRTTREAALRDGAAVDTLVRRLATRCREYSCTPILLVGIDSDAVAGDLLEIAGAARRAGFDRVLFGGSELGCLADD